MTTCQGKVRRLYLRSRAHVTPAGLPRVNGTWVPTDFAICEECGTGLLAPFRDNRRLPRCDELPQLAVCHLDVGRGVQAVCRSSGLPPAVDHCRPQLAVCRQLVKAREAAFAGVPPRGVIRRSSRVP